MGIIQCLLLPSQRACHETRILQWWKAFSAPSRTDAICKHQSHLGPPPAQYSPAGAAPGSGWRLAFTVLGVQPKWRPWDPCEHWPCWRAPLHAPGGPPGRSRWSTGPSTRRPHQVTRCRPRLRTPPAHWRKCSERDPSISPGNRGTGLTKGTRGTQGEALSQPTFKDPQRACGYRMSLIPPTRHPGCHLFLNGYTEQLVFKT